MLIEVDGRQHFWDLFERTPWPCSLKADVEKQDLAAEKGYPIVRVRQAWIWKNQDSDIWKRWLDQAIDAAASAQFVIRKEDVVLYQYHTAGETDIRLV